MKREIGYETIEMTPLARLIENLKRYRKMSPHDLENELNAYRMDDPDGARNIPPYTQNFLRGIARGKITHLDPSTAKYIIDIFGENAEGQRVSSFLKGKD